MGISTAEKGPEPEKLRDQWYSVEFSIDGLGMTCHSKVWDKAPTSMHVLVKENSDILPRLKVGDILNMKYYSMDLGNPSERLEASIQHITKKNKGKLKGHYLVGLDILKSQH
jgi:hypothetical protein